MSGRKDLEKKSVVVKMVSTDPVECKGFSEGT